MSTPNLEPMSERNKLCNRGKTCLARSKARFKVSDITRKTKSEQTQNSTLRIFKKLNKI